MAVKFLLLLLIIFLTTSTCTPHQTHYVKPDSHTNCPTDGQQCQTLAYYIKNADQYFNFNTTMIFLPGAHQLSNSTLVIIAHVENFAFIGSGEFDHTSEVWHSIPKPPAEIYCREEAAFVFYNVTNLFIANITFSRCGARATGFLNATAALVLWKILNLQMEGVVVQNSSGYGILGVDVLGNVSIYKTTLILNSATGEYEGGNVRFEYQLECNHHHESLSLIIHSSRFLLGYNFEDAAGLSLYFFGSCYAATVNISEVLFHGNRAGKVGGNMLVWISNCNVVTEIFICNSSFQYGMAFDGAGLSFEVIDEFSATEVCLVPTKVSLLILNSSFLSNHALDIGGGISIYRYKDSCHEVTADIRDVTMDRNTAKGLGGGLAVYDDGDSRATTAITVSGGSVTSGSASIGGGMLYFSSHNRYLNITGLQFRNNSGGNMHVALNVNLDNPDNIQVYIYHSTFQDGVTDYSGGGMAFYVSSQSSFNHLFSVPIKVYLLVQNNTFLSNIAREGGGNMYMQLQLRNDSPTDIQIHVYNNTYQYGEVQEYGGGIFFLINNEDDDEPCSHTNRTALLHIENSLFHANHAKNGGGLHLVFNHACYHSKAVVTNNVFRYNKASSTGGAISVIDISHSSDSVYVSVNHCSVFGGSATNGGGLFILSATQMSYWGMISDSEITNNSAEEAGGGVTIVLHPWNTSASIYDASAYACTSFTSTGNITLHVLDTVIANNTVKHEYGQGGGLFIEIHNPTCIPTSIHIADSTFNSNQAGRRGGNIAIQEDVQSLSSAITLQNCTVKGGQARSSGGMHIQYASTFQLPLHCNCTSSTESQGAIYINSTHFIGNVAPGAEHITNVVTFSVDTQDIDKDTLSQFPVKVIALENCVFFGSTDSCLNRESCVTVLMSSTSDLYPEVGCIYEFRIQTSTFTNGYGSLLLLSTCKAVISDSQFFGNENTALEAVSSNIFFEGNTLFERNSGFNGGALSLLGGSVMFLEPNTSIMFSENDAQHAGGAIYVNDFRSFKSTITQCFFQPHMSRFDFMYKNPNISIFMENNTALIAGSSLYGGNVDTCLSYTEYISQNSITISLNSSQVFDSIFHLSPNESDFSPIASDPTGVCMCEDDKPQCEERTYNGSGFPGALHVIPAVAVGERNGVVRDGVIVAVQLGESEADYKQESVCTDKTLIRTTLCQDVQFHLHSPNGTMNVTLVPGNQEGAIFAESSYFYLLIDILPCPVGFQLQQTQQEQYACMCDVILQRHGISCSIDTQTIQRPPESWIGVNCTDLTDFCDVIIHHHCPFHYCRNEELNLHLNDIDSQCNYNHSGILCGECRPGYSLVLGTSRCLHCSNQFLSLLLVFLIAGLALVFLLMLCNMTVSDGTINGLIFYANIISINSAIFFPSGQGNWFTSFLSVFIAWINLDLGIETCFYDRMDMYQKTWLQFVFPLYIWAIVLFLITTTHYSTLASKVLVRRNAVKVLATLILLSFAKLLHTTVASLSFVILEYPDGNDKAVWLYDGNIDYLTGKHIPLFVVALLVFVLLMLPYTVVLTFSQCIQRKSSHQLFSWYTKLRLQPLFDAYAGPYKDMYRFWSGLLVTVRIVLFLVFALNAVGDPDTNLLAITTVTTLLFGGTAGLSVYKKWQLTVLESFFLINLSMLSTSTQYVRSSGSSQTAVTGTFVGLVFASFIATLTYRSYQELKQSKLALWVRNTCMKQPQQDEPGEADSQPVQRMAPVQHWEIALEDPEGGEATLIPISSCTHLQSTQSYSHPDTSASAGVRQYSEKAYRHQLQPHHCPSEAPTTSLSPSYYSGTSDNPLQPDIAHQDNNPALTDPHPSEPTTTKDHTGTISHSNTTLYQAQVAAFIGNTSDDNPEYESYNELETIQRHYSEDNLHPSHPNTTDYRDQIFEILAFDSSSHNHSQLEPENFNPMEVIHYNEDSNSDTSADEYQNLLQTNSI